MNIKLLAIISLAAISCETFGENKNDKYEHLFRDFSDSFNVYNYKAMKSLIKRDMDSANYYVGKARAYYDAESKVLLIEQKQ